jgi:acetylglutamate kinase
MSYPIEFNDIFNSIQGYRDKYADELIVIKFGGTLAEDPEAIALLARQIEYLSHTVNAKIVMVHGGGVLIDRKLKQAGLEIKKNPLTGMRVTDHKSIDLIDKELRTLNRNLVRDFTKFAPHLSMIGMAGYDGFAVKAISDDGSYTGHTDSVDRKYLNRLTNAKGNVPIIYPICFNKDGNDDPRLNVNADHVASILASQLKARRLILCSDVPGVLDAHGNLIRGLSTSQVDVLINNKTVTGGMIAKLKSAVHSAEQVTSGGVVILDGREENALLKELLTDEGHGTLIRRPERISDLSKPEFTNYKPVQK